MTFCSRRNFFSGTLIMILIIFQVVCSKRKTSTDLFDDENELLLSLLSVPSPVFPFAMNGYFPYGHGHGCVKGSSFHSLPFYHHHHHRRPHCNQRIRPFSTSSILKYPLDDHYYGHHHIPFDLHHGGDIFFNSIGRRRRIFRLCHRHLRRLFRRIRHRALLHHSVHSILHDHMHLKRKG